LLAKRRGHDDGDLSLLGAKKMPLRRNSSISLKRLERLAGLLELVGSNDMPKLYIVNDTHIELSRIKRQGVILTSPLSFLTSGFKDFVGGLVFPIDVKA
jgi:hypothetical protein